MTIKEAAEKAARYIEEHGWIQRMLENTAGNVCLLGAIQLADLHAPREEHHGCIGCQLVTRLEVQTDLESLTQWNDAPHRTKEEVLALLRSF